MMPFTVEGVQMECALKQRGEERVSGHRQAAGISSPCITSMLHLAGPPLHCVTGPGWCGSPQAVACCFCMCSR